jgi:fatty-acyl-CoA synthase
LEDQLFQLEDSEAQMLVVDAIAFRDRGGVCRNRYGFK